MDAQFSWLETALIVEDITINTTSHEEHVGEIKHLIHVIKELLSGPYNNIPFKHLPGRLNIELAYTTVLRLNIFYPQPRILPYLSPREVVTE